MTDPGTQPPAGAGGSDGPAPPDPPAPAVPVMPDVPLRAFAPDGGGTSDGGGTISRRRGYGVLAAGGIALGMHLMVGASYALTLLLAPVWVSVVLALWWLALLLAGLMLLGRRSLWVLAVPLVAIGSWAALIAAGRAAFGWQ